MTMKIESALPTAATSGATNEPHAEEADHATAGGESKVANGGEAPLHPLFATVLASASAPHENKGKSALPITGAEAFALGAGLDKSVVGDASKKGQGAPKGAAGAQKKKSDAAVPTAGIPMVPILTRQDPAIPMTLPSFEAGAALTGDATEPALANELLDGTGAGSGLAALAAKPGTGAHAGELIGFDHVALSLEASAAMDARNGLAATSGVHRTARAIADDQIRIASSGNASTYAAIAKATSTTVTSMIHAAAASAPPHALKAESAATRTAENDVKPEAAPRTTSAANAGRSGHDGESTSGNDARGQSQPDPRAATTDGKDEARTSEQIGAKPTAAAASFSLPLPHHVQVPVPTAPVTRTAEVRAASFAEDLMSGVERAAASGRTDFEVRAFDGTRVAVNVQMKDDKVHVAFAFDAKHSAAEATVRATLGTLETRLGERGLSAVVSFGSLQRAPHEPSAITATTHTGAGSNATSNGQGQGGKNQEDPRGEPQLAEVTELAPRPRQGDARNGSTKTPATPNGRGGWVA